MPRRPLGGTGLSVSAIGLGCMGLSEFYGPTNESKSLRALEAAAEQGIDFLDTADMYGPYTNESLIGRFLRGRRDRFVVATKCGIVRGPDPRARGVDNRPEHIRASCDGSLKRLGVECIDLYYLHRIDPQVAIEESVGALADLVRAGKVRSIGLSEPSAETLRRAHAVHPIAAVQSEFSLATRDMEATMLPLCRTLGIAFVAYSPLGRGLLSARPPAPETLSDDDFRRQVPRFSGEAWKHNARLASRLAKVAHDAGCDPAQLALGWILHTQPHAIPIPGSRRPERIAINASAASMTVPAHVLRVLDRVFAPGAVRGDRSSVAGMRLLGH